MTPAATNPYGIAPLAVYQVQGIFAAIFFGLILLALPFLREPPPGYAPTTAQYKDERSVRGFLVRALATKSDSVHATTRTYTFLEAVWTQEMALVAFVFFCCEITGLVRGPPRAPPRGGLDPPPDAPRPDARPSPAQVFLSSAADMVQNTFKLTATEAATITSYLNLVNFAGRVAFGWLSDKIGRKVRCWGLPRERREGVPCA